MAQVCTKSFSGWGFAPDPTGGAHSAHPDPIAGKRQRKGGKGRGIEGRGGRGKGGCLLLNLSLAIPLRISRIIITRTPVCPIGQCDVYGPAELGNVCKIFCVRIAPTHCRNVSNPRVRAINVGRNKNLTRGARSPNTAQHCHWLPFSSLVGI